MMPSRMNDSNLPAKSGFYINIGQVRILGGTGEKLVHQSKTGVCSVTPSVYLSRTCPVAPVTDRRQDNLDNTISFKSC